MYKKTVGILICMLFFGASILPCISADIEDVNISNKDIVDIESYLPPDQLDQYQYGCNGVSYAENELYRKAQSFKPSLSTCTKVILRIFKSGSPDGNVIVGIRKILNEGDLTSITIDMSLIPEYWSYYEFDFPNISVIPEETYFIVFISEFKNWDGVGWCHEIYTSYDRGSAWEWDEYDDKWEEILPPEYGLDMWFEEYAQVTNFPSIKIERINGGFGVSAFVINDGTAPANNVNWSIDIELTSIGLILSENHTSDFIDILDVDETETIQFNNLRGIGLITITVQAGDAEKQATAFLLGPLVLRVIEV
jgi:hypothetical protein